MKWFRGQHPIAILLAGVAVVAGLATTANYVFGGPLLGDHPRESQPDAAKTSEPQWTEGPDSTGPTQTDTLPYCRTGAAVTVGCDASHLEEIFSEGRCARDDVLDYLGGDAQDVLMPSVAVVNLEKHCGVRLSSESNVSARDALLSRAGDYLRRCVDDRISRSVPCTETHSSEVVYVGESTTDAMCETHAAEYVSQTVSQILRFAEIEQRHQNDGRQTVCVLRARGASQLDQSVRRLGSSAWPIGQPN